MRRKRAASALFQDEEYVVYHRACETAVDYLIYPDCHIRCVFKVQLL